MVKWDILGWSGFEPETGPKGSGNRPGMVREAGNAFLWHMVKINIFGQKSFFSGKMDGIDFCLCAWRRFYKENEGF